MKKDTVYTFVEEKKRAYFYVVPSWISRLGLTPNTFRLYCAYCELAETPGDVSMELSDLAKDCNMSVNEVAKSKKELIDKNLLSVQQVTESGITCEQVEIDQSIR